MNRPDFMIRQLNYYASLNYPDTIYIGDSSDDEKAAVLQKEIHKLKNFLNISYQQYPPGDGVKCIIQLLACVKEKYVTFIGDDDYQVPSALYSCADFLENNPDYETATGKSVTIRVENNQAYGKLTGIHDYPRFSIEDGTAAERLSNHLGVHFNSIVAAVLRTQHMLKYFQDSYVVNDTAIKGEVLPCCLMIIAGKSKVIDQLGLVRQIHTHNIRNADIFDQITGPGWPESYALIRKILVVALIDKENISQRLAEETVKKSFWSNINNQLSVFYPQYLAIVSPSDFYNAENKTKVRTIVAAQFPFLKQIYRKFMRPMLTNKQQLHYEVTQPSSKYYGDFQSIVKSLEHGI